jgi:hypothetical protein
MFPKVSLTLLSLNNILNLFIAFPMLLNLHTEVRLLYQTLARNITDNNWIRIKIM